MKKIINLIFNFFFSSYFKFGVIALSTYLIELAIYVYLVKFYSIFYSNIFAAFIGVSLDYFISTSKKLNIFVTKKSNKLKFYIFYLIYISVLIVFLSWLIQFLDTFINQAIISKLIVIPLGFTLNYLYFFVLMRNKWLKNIF